MGALHLRDFENMRGYGVSTIEHMGSGLVV